jgi:molybdopterin converting factor small subunit
VIRVEYYRRHHRAQEDCDVGETDVVHVHYWAGAKHAAGTGSDRLEVDGALTLADVVRRAVALHPGTDLERVLAVCSTLIGEQPVSSRDPGSVRVEPGATVEFLPPFAGG